MWVLVLGLAGAESAWADELQAWIERHAVVVRSLDAGDEDFGDLEPLIDAIGERRVVQLGEPSHEAGGSFAAKVRLVKFLHQRMGFDVLAWESGLYGLELTQAGMRGSEDAVSAARRGIFTIWAGTQEVKPLFEYAKASQSSTRPLDMAGFCMQTTADKAAEGFAVGLRSFVRVVRDEAVSGHASELAEQAIAAHERIYAWVEGRRRKQAEAVKAGQAGKALQDALADWEAREGRKLQPRPAELASLERAVGELLGVIRSKRVAFEQVHAGRDIALMERALANMRADGASMYGYLRERDNPPAASNAERWSARDALNAANLRWLIEEHYAGRKIIVWAHNVHVMNAYYSADFRVIRTEAAASDLKPSGAYLADWLKPHIYTIAITAYEGAERSTASIPPAPEGSLEARLHRLGKPFVFLDLRVAAAQSDHPLRKPMSMRIDKYRDDTLTDITRAFDGIFYLDRMTPATRN